MKRGYIKPVNFRFLRRSHEAIVSQYKISGEEHLHIQLLNSALKKWFGLEHIRVIRQKNRIFIRNKVNFLCQLLIRMLIFILSPALEAATITNLRVA